ncbi:MAG: UDP-N-acetyl glucosamine 2-epimerase [candidate division WOR-3 bacterium]
MDKKIKVVNVVGARPNLMKIGPLIAEMKNFGDIEQILVHTGQHYDDNMSKVFFEDLDLPDPDIYLGVGSAPRDEQISRIVDRLIPVLSDYQPDLVVVVGDVNSTLAGALAADRCRKSCNQPHQIDKTDQIDEIDQTDQIDQSDHFRKPYIAHIEAGLRSFDLSMPEEINRIETDRLADFLFTTEPSANDNLKREGIDPAKIYYVGNVMIDSLVRYLDRALINWKVLQAQMGDCDYLLVTLHRPCNVDEPCRLKIIISALTELARDLLVIFPVHPRTRKSMINSGISVEAISHSCPNLRFVEPMGYLDFLGLMYHSKLVLTDSGGIQEETTYLKIPCLTLRPNTERPITIEIGTNRLVDIDQLVETARTIIDGGRPGDTQIPPLWDGRTAERIVEILRKALLR